MSKSLKFNADHRVLVVAPHPDDESLAAGGLIQKALAARAKVRVLFGSDGDNNPWPQRVVERKLRISSDDRARWGARRRDEALAAIVHLGLPANAAHFFGFPDQGITRFLLTADELPIAEFAAAISDFQPNMLVMPSASDRHPDHNAMFVLIRLALARLGIDNDSLAQFTYLVHTKGRHSDANRWVVKLRGDEKQKKREAILCHESQMALSRKRFVGYAKDTETFYLNAGPTHFDTHHPIITGMIEDGALRLLVYLRKPRSNFSGRTLYVAIQSLAEESVRWALPLASSSGRVPLRHAATGEKLRTATVRIRGRRADIRMPIAPLLPVTQVFVKLQRRVMFFDESGWRELPVVATQAIAAQRDEMLAMAI